MLIVMLATLLRSAAASATSHGEWLAKRRAVLQTVWADGVIPTTRVVPDHVLPSAFTNVSWLVWDITGGDGHPMNATAWYHPVKAAGPRSRSVILLHGGHDSGDDGTAPIWLLLR